MTGRRRADLDEDDVRVRPGRGKSRPRSKERPAHLEAIPGFVIAVDRGRFTVALGAVSDDPPATLVHAVKARELGRKSVTIGDRVELVGDVSGVPDTRARIVRINERTGSLRRSADDVDTVERVFVANATKLAIVVAVANPEPRTRLIDRCLVAGYDAGLAPLLIVTKVDLAEPTELIEAYGSLGIPMVLSRKGADPADLDALLQGEMTVLVGASGVGKSTLVNRLVPGTDRSTGSVNTVTGRGRHTSTSAVVLRLPNGGWVVDTPGVRTFGLAHVDPARVFAAFPDLAAGTTDCPRACSHDEPECALPAFVAAGHAGPGGVARLDSLRRLLRSRAGEESGARTASEFGSESAADQF
jgi:ribosome biogenesis GTPase